MGRGAWCSGDDNAGRHDDGDTRRSFAGDEGSGRSNRTLRGHVRMRKQEVRAIIEKVGIVPVIRASSAEEARFAADCVAQGGVPIVEITMTVPGAVEVIRELVKAMPQALVGAGTVLDEAAARQCADAGAQFLVT